MNSSPGSTSLPSAPQITGNALDRAELQEVARLHRSALPQAFLSSLGLSVLTEFYAGVQRFPGGVLLVARAGDEKATILGFVSGVDDVAAFHRWLTRKHFPRAIFKLLPSLGKFVCSPSVWRKLMELLFYPRRSQRLEADLPRAELLSLGVAETHRRQGIARDLYADLMHHFQQQQARAFRILVGGQLTEAARFYLAQGAREVARFELHHGHETLAFVQELQAR